VGLTERAGLAQRRLLWQRLPMWKENITTELRDLQAFLSSPHSIRADRQCMFVFRPVYLLGCRELQM